MSTAKLPESHDLARAPRPDAQRREAAGDTADPAGPIGGVSKRAFDILLAATLLLLLAPLLLAVTLLLVLTQRGSVIFAHERVGFRGRPFACYKFRTMSPDAAEVLRRHLESDAAARREWNDTRKLRHDPRITLVGRVLRKSSIDELPQLFNVLKGDMSCVGARPVVEDELARYGSEAEQYLRARPGMTGLWQVSGRSRLIYDARVALDATYVRNWSFARDLLILLLTVPAVFRSGETA